MSAYPDSSFLVALFALEPGAEKALAWMKGYSGSLIFTPFHRHEIRTAVRQKVFRGEMSTQERADAFREIDLDIRDGTLAHTQIPWIDAFREADLIGSAHGENRAARTFDLLHLGIAISLKAELFVTFDLDQRELARAAGLKIAF